VIKRISTVLDLRDGTGKELILIASTSTRLSEKHREYKKKGFIRG
jgi:hypothetical protein